MESPRDRIKLRLLPLPVRGCFPHLPAPGCQRDRSMDPARPCFPLLDLATRDARPHRGAPATGEPGTGRSRR
jgi:hypothetical protein